MAGRKESGDVVGARGAESAFFRVFGWSKLYNSYDMRCGYASKLCLCVKSMCSVEGSRTPTLYMAYMQHETESVVGF